MTNPPPDPSGQPYYPQQPSPAAPPYYQQSPYYPQPSAAPPSQPYYPYPPNPPYPPTGPTGYPPYPSYQQAPAPQKASRAPLLILLAVVLILAVAGGGYYFLTHRTTNVAGTWDMTFTTISPSSRVEDDKLSIQQSGDQLTVVATSGDPNAGTGSITLTGNVSGQNISMTYTESGCTVQLSGTVSDANHMAGSWTTRCDTDTASGTWSASRTGS